MKRLLTGSVVLVGLLSILAGCGGEGVDCTNTGNPTALVGGGTDSTGFVPLSSGATMTVVLGPQGLYMVTPSVRTENLYPGEAGRVGNGSDPVVEFSLFLGSTNIGGSAREHLGLTPTADGDEKLGVFTPFTPDISTYINQTITVQVDVEDACGRTASDSLDVVAEQ